VAEGTETSGLPDSAKKSDSPAVAGMGGPGGSGEKPPDKTSLDKQPWLYENPAAALKAVHERYYYWSSKLTDSSYTLSLAVIGANWAVFGSVDNVLHNLMSQLSLTMVIAALGINLFGIKQLSEAHDEQVGYGETHRVDWSKKFYDTMAKDDPWPYTQKIVRLAKFLRWCRTWLPLVGGLFFLLALFTSGKEVIPPNQPIMTVTVPIFPLPELRSPTCEWSRLGLHPRDDDGTLLADACHCEDGY
jgi:hypothetical protein